MMINKHGMLAANHGKNHPPLTREQCFQKLESVMTEWQDYLCQWHDLVSSSRKVATPGARTPMWFCKKCGETFTAMQAKYYLEGFKMGNGSNANKKKQTKTASVQLDAPVKDTDMVRVGHIDTQLDNAQRIALRRLFDGLQDQGAKLRNGFYVNRQPDAIKWMLEQIDSKCINGKP